jgi:ATP-binding cassette, subfamily B, bacterial
MTDLRALTWSAEALGHAMEVLARKSGFRTRAVEIPTMPSSISENPDGLGEWINSTARWFGFEADALLIPWDDLNDLLRSSGPALFRVPEDGTAKFFAVVHGQRRVVFLLGPDLAVREVSVEVLRSALAGPLEAPLADEVLKLVDEIGIPEHRKPQARQSLSDMRLRGTSLGPCWRLRLPPSASFWRQMRQARLQRRFLGLVCSNAAEYFLWIVSWWLIGRGALEGRFDRGWLLAWALLLLTIIPFRLLNSWLQGVLSIGIASLLKRRLLVGALRLAPEEIRSRGAGQFLGQVIESEAIESTALSGAFLGLTAAIELIAASVVFVWGAGATLLRLLLMAWIGLTLLLAYQFFSARKVWTERRLAMTHDLIESLVGHRTRMAQETHWHEGEDEALERYLEISQSTDSSAAMLFALVPRGWLTLGLLGLTPAFVSGQNSPVKLATAVGGILLAYRALRSLTQGLSNLADAAISWRQVAALFHAAARTQPAGLPAFAVPAGTDNDEHRKLIDGHELAFRYPGRGEPVLRGCTLSIASGDRILLEGDSGGGKSTLASVLVGLRTPQSGLLLMEGLDWQTLGMDGWRRRIVSVPQFHENHVFTESFGFNLLMGRRWPPAEEDFREAKDICRELGLRELVERMPAGLLQMVGETGWQLSHGERSRLYIARALLQRTRMIILDESFAALDPETLRQTLKCVLKRAPTLMVIAHP